MKRTRYRIIKEKSTATEDNVTEFGLKISNGKEKVIIVPISSDRREVKAIVGKLRPHNLSPAIAKEVIEDLIYTR